MAQFRKPVLLVAGLAFAVAFGVGTTAAADKNDQSPSVISPDLKVGVLANGKEITFTDLASGRLLRVIKGHTDTVTALAYSPDGKFLISGSKDQTIRIWDGATGKEVRRMNGHKAAITSLAVSGDGRSLTSQSKDKKTIVWDLATGKIVPQKK
jgi:WD40 repeat protein